MSELDKKLIDAAVGARENAYAPYSNFQVGAALLLKDGRVISGCNVENASYGLTNCAERVAIQTAVAQGEQEFEALAISVIGGGTPCGACRQVINEFAPELRLLLVDEKGGSFRETKLSALLPQSFGPKNLG